MMDDRVESFCKTYKHNIRSVVIAHYSELFYNVVSVTVVINNQLL